MKMTLVGDEHKKNEKFPIGMRVLAVDDDRTCLMILKKLLLKCQYHVTTAENAIDALNLLRENKKNFDLVISNVHMPDMDGFKLLELIGLEMDLPVIMFSANDDPKMVMKGITHGACDYLLKPVRLKEVQIIWQHVIRKKKSKRSNSDSVNGVDSAVTGSSDKNVRPPRKRKDKKEEEEEEEENEDDDDDDEDPSAQKKARVVWDAELHRMFVSAVNQLGIDKAVPKKILDLMNVEKLTRENVASHLQKYRLYLKKISCEENQQANMAAALGGSADTSYFRMNSLNGVGGHLPTMNGGSTQFHNNPFRPFQSNGMSNNRLNTPANVNSHGSYQPAITRANPNDIQRTPIPPVGLDQLQHNRGINISPINNITIKFPDYRPKVPSSVLDISNNPMMMESNSFSFPSLEKRRFNDVWSSNMQLPGVTSNAPFQGWDNNHNNNNHEGNYHSNHVIGSSVIPAVEQEENLDYNYCDSLHMRDNRIPDLPEGSSMREHQVYMMNQLKSQNNGISKNIGSLEDVVNDMVKQKQLYAKFSGGTSM
ncbi:two-component response regulator ARR12-like isoform X2 [Vicia villosa]|uniref:two-component response regulator ARR12-like isoform X2 n=1 Tax=Vicia villosa TaxID=3911 RepID=UPI00273B0AE2|nr:two-component response regulator ARR12-like isoform X2 [Vicia villosa]